VEEVVEPELEGTWPNERLISRKKNLKGKETWD